MIIYSIVLGKYPWELATQVEMGSCTKEVHKLMVQLSPCNCPSLNIPALPNKASPV